MKNRFNTAKIIMMREFRAYFTSPIAYIVTGLFLLATGIWFFRDFFLYKQPELRRFFSTLPYVLSLIVPAMTMRMVAEEKKSGSIETLVTLPVTLTDIILGKFMASFISGCIMIAPTLLYMIPCFVFGSADAGPMIAGYIGSLFLLASFCAIGLFASCISNTQILSFFLAMGICLLLVIIKLLIIFMPSFMVAFIQFISAGSHFESISRGIIDTRDIIYFLSLTTIFVTSAIMVIKSNASNK